MARCSALAALALSVSDAWIIDLNMMLPMRDGVKLHTRILSKTDKQDRVPTVIDRSPYGAVGTELVADIYAALGDYVAIGQDMRGTGASEGHFQCWREDGIDAYDTMEWISKQEWSDGTVYTVGGSADGITQFVDVLQEPPWMKAQFIIVATIDAVATMLPGGAYREGLISKWLNSTVKSQAHDVIQEVAHHEGSGAWWDPLNVSAPKNWEKIHAPAVMWGGWYDIFLQGNLNGHFVYQYLADPKIRGKNYLVVDPLGHCQAASKYFPLNAGELGGRKALGALLSVQMIKGNGTIDSPAEGVKFITFYVMGPDESIVGKGASGNYWSSLDHWPVFTPQKYYLTADGGLALAGSDALSTTADADTSRTYTYDPSDPVPTLGGNNLEVHPCGPTDQMPAENRSDVLIHTSAPLTDDLYVTGPLVVHLTVSMDTAGVNDTDFTAKLTDVYPDGSSHLIQDGIYRMRWRKGNAGLGTYWPVDPSPITAGQAYHITINLWNTSYVFNKGHRLRVAVSSSNFPRYKVNPNLGVPLSDETQWVSKYNVVNNTVHYSTAGAALAELSYLELPMVHKLQVPRKILPALETPNGEWSGVDKKTVAAASKLIEWMAKKIKTTNDEVL